MMEKRKTNRIFAIIIASTGMIAFGGFYILFSRDSVAERTDPLPPTLPSSGERVGSDHFIVSSVPPASKTGVVKDRRLDLPPSSSLSRVDGAKPKPETAAIAPSITFNAAAARSAQAAEGIDTPEVERVQNIELHADSGGCKACSNSQTSHLTIPPGCTYVRHTLTQLHREPYAPIEQARDKFTEYKDFLDPDEKGQIQVVRLSVEVRKSSADAIEPSITMRLTVVAECPADLTDAGLGGG